MILYPAIDLKGGQCVRLLKGDMNRATVYGDNPAAQAKAFEDAGFTYLHVVDLDGAVDGQLVNKTAVENILNTITIPMQFGGGIRNRATAELWLAAGVSRIILGTVALKNPALVKELARDFPHRIVVGIDAKNGMVAVEGWVEESTMPAVDLAQQFEDAGVAAIIYTDIARDGTLAGPNIAETAALGSAVSIPVILSGGIGKLDDIAAVKRDGAGAIEGIIMGRALYENTLNPREALALAAA